MSVLYSKISEMQTMLEIAFVDRSAIERFQNGTWLTSVKVSGKQSMLEMPFVNRSAIESLQN